MIGGTSSINGMVAVRGLPSDYDDWAARGAAGWDWNGVLPFFRKLETDQNFSGPLHGNDGPVPLRRIASGWPPFVEGVFAAVAALGYKNIHDQNGAFGDGYFPIAISIEKLEDQLAKKVNEQQQLRLNLEKSLVDLRGQIERQKLDAEASEYRAEQNRKLRTDGLVSEQTA